MEITLRRTTRRRGQTRKKRKGEERGKEGEILRGKKNIKECEEEK